MKAAAIWSFSADVLAGALAIGQVGLAQAGERGVLGGVFDAHAEVATAAVEIKRADLEDGLAAAGVEIAEGDEVAQELEQVAVVTDEAVHDDDLVHGGFERLVLGDGGGEDGRGNRRRGFRATRARPSFSTGAPARAASHAS